MTAPKPAHISARLRIVLLLVLFAAPVLGAYALYFWAPEDWRPTGKTHHGQLINPARPVGSLSLHDLAGQRVDASVFQGKWTLLMIGSGECVEDCQARLYDLRQVRTALGRHRPRVQRIYVATSRNKIEALQPALAPEHPDLRLLVAEGAEVYSINRQFATKGRNPLDNPYDVYLLDPHGNWLMVYTPEDSPKGLLGDLKKLLRLSNIG